MRLACGAFPGRLVEAALQQRGDRIIQHVDPGEQHGPGALPDRPHRAGDVRMPGSRAQSVHARQAATWSARFIGSNGLVSTPATS